MVLEMHRNALGDFHLFRAVKYISYSWRFPSPFVNVPGNSGLIFVARLDVCGPPQPQLANSLRYMREGLVGLRVISVKRSCIPFIRYNIPKPKLNTMTRERDHDQSHIGRTDLFHSTVARI